MELLQHMGKILLSKVGTLYWSLMYHKITWVLWCGRNQKCFYRLQRLDSSYISFISLYTKQSLGPQQGFLQSIYYSVNIGVEEIRDPAGLLHQANKFSVCYVYFNLLPVQYCISFCFSFLLQSSFCFF